MQCSSCDGHTSTSKFVQYHNIQMWVVYLHINYEQRYDRIFFIVIVKQCLLVHCFSVDQVGGRSEVAGTMCVFL